MMPLCRSPGGGLLVQRAEDACRRSSSCRCARRRWRRCTSTSYSAGGRVAAGDRLDRASCLRRWSGRCVQPMPQQGDVVVVGAPVGDRAAGVVVPEAEGRCGVRSCTYVDLRRLAEPHVPVEVLRHRLGLERPVAQAGRHDRRHLLQLADAARCAPARTPGGTAGRCAAACRSAGRARSPSPPARAACPRRSSASAASRCRRPCRGCRRAQVDQRVPVVRRAVDDRWRRPSRRRSACGSRRSVRICSPRRTCGRPSGRPRAATAPARRAAPSAWLESTSQTATIRPNFCASCASPPPRPPQPIRANVGRSLALLGSCGRSWAITSSRYHDGSAAAIPRAAAAFEELTTRRVHGLPFG